MKGIELFSRVVLLKDIPEPRLVRGHVGTVVDLLSGDALEVEFSDDDGVTYAQLPLRPEDILRIYNSPLDHVA